MSWSGARFYPTEQKAGPRRRARSRLLRITLVLTLAALLIAPGATAGSLLRSEASPVAGSLMVPSDQDRIQDGTLLFSGSLDHSGPFEGPLLAMQTHEATLLQAETLRIYDINDPVSIARLQPHLEITQGTLVPEPGASFYWSLPAAHADAHSDHTFAFLFNIEANLPDMGLLVPKREGEAPPSLIAQATTDPWTIAAPGAERSVFLPIDGGFRIDNADTGDRLFEGDQWLVTLRGDTRATVQAEGVALPFEEDATARMGPATGSQAKDAFTAGSLVTFLTLATRLADGFTPPSALPEEGSDHTCLQRPESCLPDGSDPHEFDPDDLPDTAPALPTENASSDPEADDPPITLPPELATALDTLAPFLQGAFFGNVDMPLTIGDTRHEEAGFTLVRFDELTLKGGPEGVVTFSGSAPFAFTDGGVHHEGDTMRVGPMVVSILSLVLYGLAVGAWLLTRRWTLRPLDEPLTKRLRVPALFAQWGLLLGAFVLFDREVHYLIGQSLMSDLGLYGGSATAGFGMGATMSLAGTGGILVIQMILWGIASSAFGIPIALLARSALKAGGLGKGSYGFGIGLGAIATWFLGTSMILPMLDVVFGSAANALG